MSNLDTNSDHFNRFISYQVVPDDELRPEAKHYVLMDKYSKGE